MKLYAISLYSTSPESASIHKHVKDKATAIWEAQGWDTRTGYKACATAVDVGNPGNALLQLANDPDWLQDLPRTVIWPKEGV